MAFLLITTFLGPIVAVEEPEPVCCHKIEHDGYNYTLSEMNSTEVGAWGCNTAGNCIYTMDGSQDQYCFQVGGPMTDCLQAHRECDDFLVVFSGAEDSKEFHFWSPPSALCKIDCHMIYGSLEERPTAIIGFYPGKMIEVRTTNHLYYSTPEAPQWQRTDHGSFANYGLTTNSHKIRYFVGGERPIFGATNNVISIDSVVKKHKEPTWVLDEPMTKMLACLADSDKYLVTVGGYDEEGVGKTGMFIYQTSDGQSTKVDTTFFKDMQMVCRDKFAYVLYGSDLYVVDVTAPPANLSAAIPTGSIDSRLVDFNEEIAVVGGTMVDSGQDVANLRYFTNGKFVDGPAWPYTGRKMRDIFSVRPNKNPAAPSAADDMDVDPFRPWERIPDFGEPQ